MPLQTLEIGGTPADEDCAQTGSSKYDYFELNRLECLAYITALKRKYGEPPEGARLVIKNSAHDFGTYCEACVRFDPEDPKHWTYAELVEPGLATWDEVDMWPPVKYDDHGNAVHVLRNPASWDRTTNPDCQEIGPMTIGAVLSSKTDT